MNKYVLMVSLVALLTACGEKSEQAAAPADVPKTAQHSAAPAVAPIVPANDKAALVEQAKGDWRPQLIFARENDFSSEKNLFGLYMNRREAVQALRKLVEAHRLCHKQTGLFPEKDCGTLANAANPIVASGAG